MRRLFAAAFLLILLAPVCRAADSAPLVPRTIKDVNDHGRFRDMVVVAGVIERVINSDYLVLTDGTGQMILSSRALGNRLKVDDRIVAYGRFVGRSSFDRYKGQLEVARVALKSSPEANELVRAHGIVPPPPTPAPSEPPMPADVAASTGGARRTVEERLDELDRLHASGRVTEAEYQRLRERILGDL